MPLAHNEMAEHMLGVRWGPGKVKNGTAALIPRQPRRRWGRARGRRHVPSLSPRMVHAVPFRLPTLTGPQPGSRAREPDKQASGDRPPGREDRAAPRGPSPLLTDPRPPFRRHLPGLSRWPRNSLHLTEGGLFPHTVGAGTHSGGHPALSRWTVRAAGEGAGDR